MSTRIGKLQINLPHLDTAVFYETDTNEKAELATIE